MTDVDARITIARADLLHLAGALRRMWAIDLDRVPGRRPPLAAEEWEVEPGQARAAHPNLRRPNVRAVHTETGSGIAQPAPWTPPRKGSVEWCWIEISRELARAHRELMMRTDWPADDDETGHGWRPGAVLHVVDISTRDVIAIGPDRARVVSLDEALHACEGLSLGLEWARGELRAERLMAPERHGVLESCAHATAARKLVPEGLDREPAQPEPDPPKPCSNAANGCRNKAREDGTQCQVCANYRAKHGHDRTVGDDGRAEQCDCKTIGGKRTRRRDRGGRAA
jgi:hypothetical protein